MYIYKLLNSSFIFLNLLIIFLFSFLIKFSVVDFYQILKYKGMIFSFISIYFLVDINRVINFPYISLVHLKSILKIYLSTLGLFLGFLYFIFLFLGFDFILFLKEVILLCSLLLVGSYLQIINKKNWVKYLIINIFYFLVTSMLWT